MDMNEHFQLRRKELKWILEPLAKNDLQIVPARVLIQTWIGQKGRFTKLPDITLVQLSGGINFPISSR
jgi:hypothetical protein